MAKRRVQEIMTKKEFADELNMTTSTLAVYISRGKVNAFGDLIDVHDPKNEQFISKRKSGKYGDIKKKLDKEYFEELERKAKSELEGIDEAEAELMLANDNIPEIALSEQKLKYLDTLKREKEIVRLKLDIDKKQGKVVPSDAIGVIMAMHNRSILTAMKNMIDNILRIYSTKYGMSNEDISEMRANGVDYLNKAMQETTELSLSNIDKTIDEHSDKRYRGEHGIYG